MGIFFLRTLDCLVSYGPRCEKNLPSGGGVDKECFKPVSSAIETSLKIEILPFSKFTYDTFQKANKKALIRLSGCAGWTAPVLFANPPKTGFLASRPIL